MRPGARVQAAIDVMSEIMERGRSASLVLSDWGRSHRFAGSSDRAAIGNLVYDALRKKQSYGWYMQNDQPRALILAVLRYGWDVPLDEITSYFSDVTFASGPVTEQEKIGLQGQHSIGDAPAWIKGDYPEWLDAVLQNSFGEDRVFEGVALSERAPIDLRVNTLKATREKVIKALARFDPEPTPYSPLGIRLPARQDGLRSGNVETDAAHGRGLFEVQDEGSQLSALLAGATARLQIGDICAGAGGKTLALAAAMQNTGQIYAYDTDATRFRPIFDRLKRAGARNVQTLTAGDENALMALENRLDLVLIDAPCSGTGAWRRKPDTKWRLKPDQLAKRQQTQSDLLRKSVKLLKSGGRLVYITCSILKEENEDQIENFLKEHDNMMMNTPPKISSTFEHYISKYQDIASLGILLTPLRTNTDGFFVSNMQKRD